MIYRRVEIRPRANKLITSSERIDGSGIGAGVETARVVDAQIEPYTYNGVPYESVRFELEVITTA